MTNVIGSITRGEARLLVNRIRDHINDARALVLELYEREGWIALGYGSWRECVVGEFDQSKSHLYRLLDAAKVERNISPIGEKPITESVLRPLSKLEPNQQIAAWQLATETSPTPTAAIVEQAVSRITRKEQNQPALSWTQSQLERKALLEQNLTVVASMSADASGLPVDNALITWAESLGRAVRIDRTTDWGNPFILDKDGSRAEVISWFAEYFANKRSLRKRLGELCGKTLLCWCYPESCHGDHLAHLANNL